MNQKQRELITLFKKLTAILEEHKIWGVVDGGTLLGAIRHNGFVPGDDDIDITTTYEGFCKLRELCPENFFTCQDAESPLLFGKFVNDKKTYQTDFTFIDVFYCVPTTMKRVKKLLRPRNLFRFLYNVCFGKPLNIHVWYYGPIKGLLVGPIAWKLKPITDQDVYATLYEPDHPQLGYVTTHPIKPLYFNAGQTPLNYFDRKQVRFENEMDVYVPKEYDTRLKLMYGENYLTPIVAGPYEHDGVFSFKPVKHSKNLTYEQWKQKHQGDPKY